MVLRPKTKKILSFIAISIFGIVIGISITFYILLKLSVPVTNGRIELSGLFHQVEITFDRMGIPQIWAETAHDAYFALGYQHAADRMFQMDLARRLAQGKLSEMLGGITLNVDIEQRKIGHTRLAFKALNSLSENNRLLLQAYADGVNAYKNNCRALPFEYRFLPIDFEDWMITDCLALLSFQTWYSNGLMNRDEFYLKLIGKVGEEKAKSLLFPYPEWAPTTVPSGEQQSNLNEFKIFDKKFNSTFYRCFPKIQNDISCIDDNFFYQSFQSAVVYNLFGNNNLPLLMSHSSNAWVIAPERSASGKAMLASDPHLDLTRLPQFWYAVGIHVKEDKMNVLGITTPGLPLVVMGHNGYAAWAFTAGGADVTDYFIEQVNPADSNQYLTADGWAEFELIYDSLHVAGRDSLIKTTYKFTRNGPVISESEVNGEVYTLHWAGFDVDLNEAVTNSFNLHHVNSFEQFQEVVTGLGALDVNMMYADADGSIGYQLATPIPVRVDDDNNIPISGAGRKRWNGFYPLDRTPHYKNPEGGWLASCNNLPERSGNVRGHFFASRILSINELLQSKERFSIDDMYRFQTDRVDRYLRRFRVEFASVLEKIGEDEKAMIMRRWDGSTNVDSKETALISVYLSQLKKATFEDELGNLYYQVPNKWIEQIKQVDGALWFDDVNTSEQVETYTDISTRAMKKAVEIAGDKRWGEMHSLQMQHPMAMIPIIGYLLGLSSDVESWGGTPGSLNSSFYRQSAENKFTSLAGPSWRFVIDFADIDKTTMVLPAGNSGNPMSEHFFDFYEMWKKGERWNVPFHYEKVKQNAVSTLLLEPSKKL